MNDPYILLPMSKVDVDALLHLFSDVKYQIERSRRTDPDVIEALSSFIDRIVNDIYSEVKARGYVGTVLAELERSMRKIQ